MSTTLAEGDLSGLSQGGLITLVLSLFGLLFVWIAPKLVVPVMTIVTMYALVVAYFRPGGLVGNYGGGEADISWGLGLLIVASALTAVTGLSSGGKAIPSDT